MRRDFLKNKHFILIILLIVYLASLLIVIFTSNDLFDSEECYFGTAAYEFIAGPTLPFFDYQASAYQGGSLLESLAAAPFFMLFGITFFSLKMGNLFFLIPMFVLLYYFLERFFDRRVAIIGCLLMIFAPKTFIVRGLILNGHFFHSMLLSLLIMFIFFEIFYNNKKIDKYFMIFGFICGFALWFDYTNIVILLIVAIFWFVFDKKFITKKTFLIFTIFFLIGFSPWIFYNTTHEFSGIYELIDEKESSYIDWTTRVSNLLYKDLPMSFHFSDLSFEGISKIANYFYYLVFLCSAIFLLFKYRKAIIDFIAKFFYIKKGTPLKDSKFFFIILYIIIFIMAYGMVDYKSLFVRRGVFITDFLAAYKAYNIITPLYIFMFITIALLIAYLWQKDHKYSRYTATIITIIIIFLGIINISSLISFEEKNEKYWPVCYGSLPQSIGWTSMYTPSYGLELCNLLKENIHTQMMINFCYEEIGKGLDWRFRRNSTLAMEECDKLEEKYQSHCYFGVGRGIGWRSEWNEAVGLDICENLKPIHKDICKEGVIKEATGGYMG